MNDQNADIPKMDADNLWREQTYTDRRVGTIRTLTPVTVEGEVDISRKTLYLGQTQVMTPAGALPISFELDVETLAEAVDSFAAATEAAIEETMKELEEMRREAASRIVIPGQGGPRGMPPGGGGGFQLP